MKKKNLLITTMATLGFTFTIMSQTNIPKNYLGFYRAPLYHEDDSYLYFFIDSASKETTVYGEDSVGGNRYATYYKILSFNEQNGEIIIQSKFRISKTYEGDVNYGIDTTYKTKLIFMKNKKNELYINNPLKDGVFGIFIKYTQSRVDILSAKGVHIEK